MLSRFFTQSERHVAPMPSVWLGTDTVEPIPNHLVGEHMFETGMVKRVSGSYQDFGTLYLPLLN